MYNDTVAWVLLCDREGMDWYRWEQRELANTLRAVGPDAPTLCAGWRSRHLAAHLYLRLHRPGQFVTGLLPGLPDTDTRTMELGEAHADPEAYEELLHRFLAEPAVWNPMALAGDAIHLLEYVVHHEDVRRADGPVQPRNLAPEHLSSLWVQVRRAGRNTQARARTGMVLVVPGGPRAVVRRARHSIAVTGDPVELALHLTGRTEHADVDVVAVAAQEPNDRSSSDPH